MKYRETDGDLIQLFLDGEFDIIGHQCNCFNTMGKGVALAIKKAFPAVYEVDQETIKGDENKLGTYTQVEYVDALGLPHYILNIYSQYNYGTVPGVLYTDYNAMRTAFIDINKQFSGKKIGLPRLGTVNGGGDWNTIKKIIQETLVNMDVTIVNYKNDQNGQANTSQHDPDSGWDDIM